jgi:hypothetical protein
VVAGDQVRQPTCRPYPEILACIFSFLDLFFLCVLRDLCGESLWTAGKVSALSTPRSDETLAARWAGSMSTSTARRGLWNRVFMIGQVSTEIFSQ